MIGAMHTDRQGGAGSRRYAPPAATYRVQLRAGFGFAVARRLVPYFAALGVSHLYCSPFFTAAPGSAHGYDVVNHDQVNPELGGLAGLYALSEALRARDMGLLADIVPNHVGLAGGANPWWRDVLRHGPASPYAPYFDINWDAQPHLPSGKLVYPILGRPFGAALEAGELRLDLADGDLVLRYYDHALPLAPATYPQIVGLPPPELRARLGDPAALTALAGILDALPAAPPAQADRLLERFRALLASEPALAAHVRARLDTLNGRPGDPASFDALDALHAAQHYRLASWRVSGEEINYRRFFDINDLAAIRVEREDVFMATHRLLGDLVARGVVTGVRVDHVDGLYDPAAYLQRLRRLLRAASAGLTDREPPIYVEKILAAGEALPPDWPVAGTTGYDFLAHADGLLVDRTGSRELTLLHERLAGGPARPADIAYAAKRQVTRTAFAGEVNVLAAELYRLAQRRRRWRDLTLRQLRQALETTLACFPVYRTYIVGEQAGAPDAAIVERAMAEARRREPALADGALDFLAAVLLLAGDDLDPDERARRVRFRRRFQQLSGPVMAKGVEDTTFFRYPRLLSLNEVGGDPAAFGMPVKEVHRWLAARARDWPHALSATSTHDTKRSEDTRARLHVLSEVPRAWRVEVRAWARLNRRFRATLHGDPVPDAGVEYHLYQTLVGAWPAGMVAPDDEYRARLAEYLTKALREMKLATSWTDPDARYEAACQDFLAALLDPVRSADFLARLAAFVARIAPAGALNALAALTLKALAPGCPDFYQGTELPALTLTDPDNRRPVDYARREALLAALPARPPADLAAPEAKLWFTHRLLALRARWPDLLAEGDYRPLATRGRHARSVFAFARRRGDACLVVALPRLTARLLGADSAPPRGDRWEDTAVELPRAVGGWRDELGAGEPPAAPGRLVPCRDLFAALPFAVLAGEVTTRPARRADS
ncbi:MAG TPA: malto-oligosyltrehalose synthase [Thermomicrobiales bacterium]|nr:malto-oligosyltrehalose synthase [Thermomicrobiales bacterium]